MSGVALVWAANVKGLQPATKLVLIQLAERHNKDTGRCDPSLAKLAEDCEMSRASLLRHLRILEDAGAITREAQGRENGGRSSNQYHLPIGQRSQFETGGKGLKSDGQRSQFEQAKVSGLRPPYKDEPVLNPKEPAGDDLFSEEEIPKVDPVEEAFERFWSIYPKKAGKKEARESFARAVKRSVPIEVIISGAQRYAAKVSGKDPTYVKYPQGWLNGERWKDDQDPASEPDEEMTPMRRKRLEIEARARALREQIEAERRGEGWE